MADETDQEAEARRQLEEYQRQQAAAALEASRNQPNAIPNEPVTAASRVSDYSDRGLVPTIEPQVGQPLETPAGSPYAVVQGAPLSQDEQAFWQANPNGAVMDHTTGALIGLGDHRIQGHQYSDTPYTVNAGLGPPATPFNQQQRINTGLGPASIPFSAPQQQGPRMVTPADLYNPQIKAQMDNLDREIATRSDALRRANTQRIGKNQPSQHEVLSNELKNLQYSRNILGDEYYRNANNSFAVMRENQKREQDANHVNAGTEIAQWMAGLPRDPIARSRAWEQELAKPERSNWLEAINGHPEVNDFVRNALTGHQTVAEQQAAIQAAAGGRPVTLDGGSEKNPRFKVSPTLGESISAQSQKDITKSLSDAGVTPEQFAQRTKVEQGNIAKDASGKETFTNDNEGTHMRVTIGDHTFAVPVGRYNQLNTAIPAAQSQPAAQQAPAAQPTGTRVVGGKTYAWNPQNKRWEPQ